MRFSPSFLLLGAYGAWFYNLSKALSANTPTHIVRFYGWRVYWHNQPDWPSPAPSLQKTIRVLPPGYAGRLEPLFRPYTRYLISHWIDDLKAKGGTHPWVVVTRPFLAPWVRSVPSSRLVYYNIDAYELYRSPSRRDTMHDREQELVERADVTLCASREQTNTLRERYSGEEEAILHFPHGVSASFINPSPGESVETRTVGYVGNLTDRVDWSLVHTVADELDDLTFIFVGEAKSGDDVEEQWRRVRRRVFSLPNVEHVGPVPQDEVKEYYWSFAVNWIPYDTDHPFNVASCPTKIMDGLASGRPVVSTPVPECLLYPDQIQIVKTSGQAVERLRSLTEKPETSGSADQVEFARENTWEKRAESFIRLLTSKTGRLADTCT